jgi:UDP-N-acetyl-D-mannosaminuronate dehydrogenase
MRESPAVAVAERLLRLGAEVRYVDDHVPELNGLSIITSGRVIRTRVTVDELVNAEAVVVLTDHDDLDYDFVAKHARYVFDTRHRCHGDVVEYL